jgi:putative acetyltransferase
MSCSEVVIRGEEPRDAAAVRALQQAAFGRATEALLVDALREDRSSVISLVAVAVTTDEIAGHVMFSKMTAPFRALGLGPVAVLPDRQRKGIGGRLIRAGLARAKADGWEGVFVVGDPRYYEQFGFSAEKAKGFRSPYAGPYLMVLALSTGDSPATTGRIEYASAFAAFA